MHHGSYTLSVIIYWKTNFVFSNQKMNFLFTSIMNTTWKSAEPCWNCAVYRTQVLCNVIDSNDQITYLVMTCTQSDNSWEFLRGLVYPYKYPRPSLYVVEIPEFLPMKFQTRSLGCEYYLSRDFQLPTNLGEANGKINWTKDRLYCILTFSWHLTKF